MYTKQIPFKDFSDKPRNETVHFNLQEREVFKLLAEFQRVFAWQESLTQGGPRDLSTEEVVDFYNDFETILLSAWGVPSDDGRYFRKSGRYEFEESALFGACMIMFVTEPEETGKLLDGLLPKGLQDMVKKADANLIKLQENSLAAPDSALLAEVSRLRTQLAEAEANANAIDNKGSTEATA